jgi:ferredoxin
MAKIKDMKTGKIIEVKDGEPIKNACERLGVHFNCRTGICGTCMIDVLEGEENLSSLTQPEKDLKRDREHRLACQCKIKEGEIGIGI